MDETQKPVELDPALLGSTSQPYLSGGSPNRAAMFSSQLDAVNRIKAEERTGLEHLASKATDPAVSAVLDVHPENFDDVAKYSVRIKVQSDAVYSHLCLDRINTEHLQHSTGQITYGWSTDDHLMTVTCDLHTYIVVTRDALTGKVLQTAEYSYDHQNVQDLIAKNTPEGGFVVTDGYGRVEPRKPKERKPIPAFRLSQFPGISHRG